MYNISMETTKKKTWKSWVLGVVFGVALVVIGTTGLIEDESVNNTLIQVGASQATAGAIEINPELAVHFAKAADVIDAAIEARTTKPDELVDIISKALNEHTATDVTPVVEAVIVHINNAHKTSETEEQYHIKLKHLAAGLRSGSAVPVE